MILLSRNGRVRADIFSRRRIDAAGSSSSRQKTRCHADQLAERIVQLDGEPNFSPEGLMGRSHAEYVEGATLLDMIREDLVAERIAIESYRDIIQYLDDKDPTTRRLLESILAVVEEHADEALVREAMPDQL